MIRTQEALRIDGGASPASSRSASEAKGIVRRSRSPRVRAWLRAIWKTQVRKLERPSKRSRPRRTPSQVSCTTSSATAVLGT